MVLHKVYLLIFSINLFGVVRSNFLDNNTRIEKCIGAHFKNQNFNGGTCACELGFQRKIINKNEVVCKDINECTKFPTICNESQRCVNTLGSYKCLGRNTKILGRGIVSHSNHSKLIPKNASIRLEKLLSTRLDKHVPSTQNSNKQYLFSFLDANNLTSVAKECEEKYSDDIKAGMKDSKCYKHFMRKKNRMVALFITLGVLFGLLILIFAVWMFVKYRIQKSKRPVSVATSSSYFDQSFEENEEESSTDQFITRKKNPHNKIARNYQTSDYAIEEVL